MKKTLSLMLALAMVFALVLVAAPAAEAAACDHTDHTGWNELTVLSFVSLSNGDGLQEGKYYLTQDLEWSGKIRIEAGHEVTICLNGYTLTSIIENQTSTFDPLAGTSADDKTKLTICDCSAAQTGTIDRSKLHASGRHGLHFMVRDNVEVNLVSGTFKCALENNHAKASLVYGTGACVVNVYEDAKFETANGNTIFMNKGTVNVYGVASNITVKAGAAADGGKVMVNGEDKTVAEGVAEIAAFKTPVSTPSNPGTGDSANLVVMGLGLILGVAGMACLLPKKQTV